MPASAGWIVSCVVAVLALLPPAARAAAFPLYGMGNEPLRSGQLAADANIVDQPIALAARADGVVAFGAGGRVFWVQGGRLVRVPVPLHGGRVADLAFAPDGALLVASCPEVEQEPAAVFRAAPGARATVVAGVPGRTGSSGDGGPATAATLRCAESIAVDADGGLLIGDQIARQVRRVDPQGTITTVAGTGGRKITGDGGPATAASIGFPDAVAALPGGGFALAAAERPGYERARPAIRVINRDGIITLHARLYASELAAEVDGSLLVTDWGENVPVRRVDPNGQVSVAVSIAGDRIEIPDFTPVDGDPFGSHDVQTDAAVPTPDGGLLVAADFGISYVAPAQPQILAVAMLPATRHVRSDLDVSVRLTRAAHVTVTAQRAGRVRARAALDAAAGDAVLPLGRLRPGVYGVRVAAEAPGQVATAHAFVLAGGRLPVSFARDFIASRLDLFETFVGGAPKVAHCRRRGARRVDCALRRRHRCAGVVSVRLRGDGSLVVRQHRRNRRCRAR